MRGQVHDLEKVNFSGLSTFFKGYTEFYYSNCGYLPDATYGSLPSRLRGYDGYDGLVASIVISNRDLD